MSCKSLLPILVLVGGCSGFSATRPYDSPVSGPRAKLTITKTVELAGVPPNPGGASFLLDVLEPDDKCRFEYRGSVLLDPKVDPKAGSLTMVLPAGRAYFRVFIRNPSIIENVSFLLEADHEYSIDYKYLGSGGYRKSLYEIDFVKRVGAERWVPVDVDHWSICRREKGIADN